MKTKMMKRAAAFAASVLMTAAMAVPAAAVPVITGKSGKVDPIVYDGNTMEVSKKIYVFNTDEKAIYEPNISYTYNVATVVGLAGKTITGLIYKDEAAVDDEGNPVTMSAVTIAGPEGGVTLSATEDGVGADEVTLTFGDDNGNEAPGVATTKEGETREKFIEEKLYIKTDPKKFEKAGVYRYIISQTTDKTLGEYGVLDQGKDIASDLAPENYYLDVYVREVRKNPTDTETSMEVYGLVLLNANEDITYTQGAEDNTKVPEFDPDEYHTLNLKVTKTITGKAADKNQKFDFSIEFSNMVEGSEFTWTNVTPAYTYPTSKLFSTGLSDGEETVFTGIPMGVSNNPSVKIYEQNMSNSTYTATYWSIKDETNKKTETLNSSDTTNQDWSNVLTGYNGENVLSFEEFDFVNNCDVISPTGLLFRVAPFALMMTAGGVLIAVYLRGKKRDDAESMI